MKMHFSGFLSFVRDRGVAGLMIGFILGGAAQKLVQALTDDILNPFFASLGGVNRLGEFTIGEFKVGDFISVTINFIVLILIVYAIFKLLQLERLDKRS